MDSKEIEIRIAENYKRRSLIAERIAMNNHILVSTLLHNTNEAEKYREKLVYLHFEMHSLCNEAHTLLKSDRHINKCYSERKGD